MLTTFSGTVGGQVRQVLLYYVWIRILTYIFDEVINQSINSPIIPLRNIGHPQESSTELYSWRCTWFLSRSFPLLLPLETPFFAMYSPFVWGFHSRACPVMSSIGFRCVWPRHPHLRFLICTSILGCFVRFHNSLFIIWSGQKILNFFPPSFIDKDL